MSMAVCMREALWVRKLLLDFNLTIPTEGISMFADNNMALKLAETGKQTPYLNI